MLTPQNVTIGVVFTNRLYNLDLFLTSCIQNDTTAKACHFVFVDNGCKEPLQEYLTTFLSTQPEFDGLQYTLVRNEKIESLTYNHNRILLAAPTDYILHTNDETYFQKDWLTKTIQWANDHPNNIAHICRCGKGYWKHFIDKMGYFNLKLNGKDGSDADIEYRELVYLEGKTDLTPQQFVEMNDENFRNRIIGGQWGKSYFEATGCPSWIGEIAVQPDNITNDKQGDSNIWLQTELKESLSDRNKTPVMEWVSLLGAQELTDIRGEIAI